MNRENPSVSDDEIYNTIEHYIDTLNEKNQNSVDSMCRLEELIKEQKGAAVNVLINNQEFLQKIVNVLAWSFREEVSDYLVVCRTFSAVCDVLVEVLAVEYRCIDVLMKLQLNDGESQSLGMEGYIRKLLKRSLTQGCLTSLERLRDNMVSACRERKRQKSDSASTPRPQVSMFRRLLLFCCCAGRGFEEPEEIRTQLVTTSM